MQNQTYLFADLSVNVSFQYNLLRDFCQGYETEQKPVLSFQLTHSMLETERAEFSSISQNEEDLEILALHRAFCDAAVFYDVLLFHSSAVMVDGKAYLFAAPSGTGKSTHASLWRDMLGDQAVMINDDKPLIRWQKGTFIVYGSPWNGKEHLGNNISAPLCGICFLTQEKENQIRSLSEQEWFPLVMQQTYRPESEEGTKNMLRLLVEMSEQVPMWHLDCTISREAAELSYNTMRSVTL